MRRKRDPVPRARSAGQWLGGILLLGLLGGATVAAAALLWENLDVRELAPALSATPAPSLEPEPPAAAGVEAAAFSAVLLDSPRNAAYFPDSTFYPQAVRRWRHLVERLGGSVREASSAADLRSVEPSELLVLPEAPCLSPQELEAIRRHVRAGGSVVSNWAVGARDEACSWRGWGVVAELTGAGDVRELPSRSALYLTVPGGMALSPGLDPGARIEFRTEPSLALTIPGPRVYWSDWALNPAPDESGGKADVAATAGRLEGGSRSAWFGFRLSQAATPQDSARVDRLVRNGIAWAAGIATAAPASWPGGKKAALVLVEDVEAEYQNASALAELLGQLGVPGTFFVVSQLVQGDDSLGRTLSRVGEVGSHTSDHAPVAGLPLSDQEVRLARSRKEVENWAGRAPVGLRPPEEAYDANTLEGWRDAGGTYLVAENQARSAAPEVHRVGDGSVVVLPRLMKDDYNVFVQEGAFSSDRLTKAFLEGVDKLQAIGGLAVVGLHTQITGAGPRLDAVRAVADTVRARKGWWMARAGEVADWWGRRAGVRVRFAQEGTSAAAGSDPAPADADRLSLTVEAPADREIRGLWIDVVLPGGSRDVEPAVDGVPVAYASTEWGVRVPVGDLGAGAIRRITFRSGGTSK
jgi:peptidoglycan/xylan/chitin deacetylase (PgdA/CDA1 family)